MPLGFGRSAAKFGLLLAALAPVSGAKGQPPVLSGYLFDAEALEAVPVHPEFLHLDRDDLRVLDVWMVATPAQ